MRNFHFVFTYLVAVFSFEFPHTLEQAHTITTIIDKNRSRRRIPEVMLVASSTPVNVHVSTDSEDCSESESVQLAGMI